MISSRISSFKSRRLASVDGAGEIVGDTEPADASDTVEGAGDTDGLVVCTLRGWASFLPFASIDGAGETVGDTDTAEASDTVEGAGDTDGAPVVVMISFRIADLDRESELIAHLTVATNTDS
jgi:hypothetical protein